MLRLPHLSEWDPQDRLEGAEIRLKVLGSARTPFHSGSVSLAHSCIRCAFPACDNRLSTFKTLRRRASYRRLRADD